MAGIALFSGPQDPSQLDALLNQLIGSINNYVNGGTAQLTPVVAASTASALAAFGQYTLNSTTRTAGTTGRYTLPAAVPGQTLTLTSRSTVKATITGVFQGTKTKLSLTTTAALATAKLPSVILRGLTTSVWAVISSFGAVTST